MKKKLLLILTVSVFCFGLVSCGNKSEENKTKEKVTEETTTEKETLSKEDFKEQCEFIMKEIEILKLNADYVGSVHTIIWDSVGVDEVSKYIKYVRNYYDDKEYESLICKAFGVSYYNGADKSDALEYAEGYVLSLVAIEEKIKVIDEMFEKLKEACGEEFDIDDIEEYYLECIAYAEYASTIDGSYNSYTQALNDYQKEIENLKNRAERSY